MTERQRQKALKLAQKKMKIAESIRKSGEYSMEAISEANYYEGLAFGLAMATEI